jgi:hypothetical protein|tara:strand:- start:2355 stop:2558 length:204 start_codon:yes stop_codon:yes gene_type:complete
MPAFALGGQSKLAASKLTMGEPADDVLESLKGMSMMDAVALQKEIDETFGLNKDDEDEEEEAPAAEE